jgi:hypothetical protein
MAMAIISHWFNTPTNERLDIRRIDVLLFTLGVVIAGTYWLLYGWQWAIMGTMMYALGTMIALWLL